ncbi:hypothetical protein JVU11DRAFT_12956 [Chiua virens]|nr:hypothetical protein JVU11DRAFT_12956 [Chiua virens]
MSAPSSSTRSGTTGKHKVTVLWDLKNYSGRTDRLVEWCNSNPLERAKLFSDSNQAAREEGREKQTNSQTKKVLMLPLVQAIFSSKDETQEFRDICAEDPSVFVPAIEQRISNLRKKYRELLGGLLKTGAGRTHDELLKDASSQTLLADIQKQLPWFNDLHGFWNKNPAYNIVFTNSNPNQDFGVQAAKLFKISDPASGSQHRASAASPATLGPVAGTSMVAPIGRTLAASSTQAALRLQATPNCDLVFSPIPQAGPSVLPPHILSDMASSNVLFLDPLHATSTATHTMLRPALPSVVPSPLPLYDMPDLPSDETSDAPINSPMAGPLPVQLVNPTVIPSPGTSHNLPDLSVPWSTQADAPTSSVAGHLNPGLELPTSSVPLSQAVPPSVIDKGKGHETVTSEPLDYGSIFHDPGFDDDDDGMAIQAWSVGPGPEPPKQAIGLTHPLSTGPTTFHATVAAQPEPAAVSRVFLQPPTHRAIAIEESLESASASDAAASHLLANLNLQVAASRSQKLSLSSPGTSLFSDSVDYSSAPSTKPTTNTSSSTRKRGQDPGQDKSSESFVSAAHSLIATLSVARDDKKAEKRARYELDLWHSQEWSRHRHSQREHEQELQQECQKHEKEMKDKDITALQLQLEIEEMRLQRLAMEKGPGTSGEEQET